MVQPRAIARSGHGLGQRTRLLRIKGMQARAVSTAAHGIAVPRPCSYAAVRVPHWLRHHARTLLRVRWRLQHPGAHLEPPAALHHFRTQCGQRCCRARAAEGLGHDGAHGVPGPGRSMAGRISRGRRGGAGRARSFGWVRRGPPHPLRAAAVASATAALPCAASMSRLLPGAMVPAFSVSAIMLAAGLRRAGGARPGCRAQAFGQARCRRTRAVLCMAQQDLNHAACSSPFMDAPGGGAACVHRRGERGRHGACAQARAICSRVRVPSSFSKIRLLPPPQLLPRRLRGTRGVGKSVGAAFVLQARRWAPWARHRAAGGRG